MDAENHYSTSLREFLVAILHSIDTFGEWCAADVIVYRYNATSFTRLRASRATALKRIGHHTKGIR